MEESEGERRKEHVRGRRVGRNIKWPGKDLGKVRGKRAFINSET